MAGKPRISAELAQMHEMRAETAAKLEALTNELAIIDRFIAKFARPVAKQENAAEPANADDKRRSPGSSKGKPSDWIVAVLKANNNGGLAPVELAKRVKERYPTANVDSVQAAVYRLHKRNILTKIGGLFSLREKPREPATPKPE